MGFFEILLIAVVTLLVVGPERMPEAVRTVAITLGRLKRAINSAREDLEQQVGADKIRLQLHNEAVMESLKNIKQQAESNTDNTIDPRAQVIPEDTPRKANPIEAPSHPTTLPPSHGNSKKYDDSIRP